MNKLIKIGGVTIALSILSLGALFIISFADCFGSNCGHTMQVYYAWIGVACTIALVLGLVIVPIGVIKLVLQDRSKVKLLFFTLIAYLAFGYASHLYFFGDIRSKEITRAMREFRSTVFEPSYLPDGYKKSTVTYSTYEGDNNGGYLRTQYDKVLSGYNGNNYNVSFFIEQSDSKNFTTTMYDNCSEGTLLCDIEISTTLGKIYCQKVNVAVCTVYTGGTYVLFHPEKTMNRNDTLMILNSLFPVK